MTAVKRVHWNNLHFSRRFMKRRHSLRVLEMMSSPFLYHATLNSCISSTTSVEISAYLQAYSIDQSRTNIFPSSGCSNSVKVSLTYHCRLRCRIVSSTKNAAAPLIRRMTKTHERRKKDDSDSIIEVTLALLIFFIQFSYKFI